MADNGRWFKLWCSSVFDQELDNLSIADFGRWCKLGAYIKEHGKSGKIILKPPQKTLCSALQIQTYDELISVLKTYPNIILQNETDKCVSFSLEFANWRKYQENLSSDRVRKFRQNETPKKRREEKRRNPPIIPHVGFDDFWNLYPRKKSKGQAEKAWSRINPDEQFHYAIIKSLEQAKKSEDWCKDGGKYIPYPATWLNARGWEDEYDTKPNNAWEYAKE